MKDKSTAYLLWLFLGLWGAHKFYLGKTGIGIIYFFTLGFFFIGWLFDLLTLGTQVDAYNALFNRAPINNNNNNSNQVVVNVAAVDRSVVHNVAEQLSQLSELREKGLLTEDEFVTQKVKLLA